MSEMLIKFLGRGNFIPEKRAKLSMDDFNRVFQRLRAKEASHGSSKKFSHALFQKSHWGLNLFNLESEESDSLKTEKGSFVSLENLENESQESELAKVDVIDALKSFVEKETEDKDEKKIQFPGGEVEDFSQSLVKLGETDVEGLEQKKVFFISDYLRGEHSGLSEESFNLLSRMAKAMKLASDDYLCFPLVDKEGAAGLQNEEALDVKKSLSELIARHRPSFVITMGVTASNTVLERSDRLTKLRGKTFSRYVQNRDEKMITQIMPIFHPDFLLINPSMKATTWSDLQIVMKEL